MSDDDDTTREYHKGMQEGRAQLELIRGGGKAKRKTLSDIIEMLLLRGSPEHSSVELTRNSKGETQINVTVRTDQQAGVLTIEDAASKAIETFDSLRSRYPMQSGFTGAPPAGAEPPSASKGA